MRAVSLMAASREFSQPVRKVERGERVLVIRRGRPIARSAPHSADKTADPEWTAACERVTAQLETGASPGRLGNQAGESGEKRAVADRGAPIVSPAQPTSGELRASRSRSTL